MKGKTTIQEKHKFTKFDLGRTIVSKGSLSYPMLLLRLVWFIAWICCERSKILVKYSKASTIGIEMHACRLHTNISDAVSFVWMAFPS